MMLAHLEEVVDEVIYATVHFAAGMFYDLHVYDPVSITWFDISSVVHGIPPSTRGMAGFTSAGGRLYVHGGWDAKTFREWRYHGMIISPVGIICECREL